MSITRVLSALVLIVIVGGTIWWLPPGATMMLAAIAAGLGATELSTLARQMGARVQTPVATFSAAAFCIVLSEAVPTEPSQLEVLLALVVGLSVLVGCVVLATNPPGASVFIAAGVMVLAPLYVGAPLGAMAWVRTIHGPAALIWLVAVITLSDSAQYYAGNLWGRRKLAPVVSPKKTVEGAIGGLVIAPIAGAAIGLWALPKGDVWMLALLSIVLAIAGMAGDLFESLLKRSAGAKDSSALIPGHGGVLDRIDAYLFAAPVFYLFLRLIA